MFAQAGGVVALFNFAEAALHVDAFLVVGFFDGWGERRVCRG